MTVPDDYRVTLTVLPDPTRTLRILRLLRRPQLAILYPAMAAIAVGVSLLTSGSAARWAVVPLALVLMAVSWGHGLQKAARRSDHPLNQPLTFEFSDEGVRISTPNSAAVHRWAAFTKVKSRADFWLLYLSRNQAIVVPQTAFTPDQDRAFRWLLATRLGYA